MVRAHVIFSGTVQGVGFRYTTQRFASNLRLTGWVKNLSDGSVQMVAEGEEPVIQDLVKRLESYFSVRDKTVIRSQGRGDLVGFEITH